MKPPTLNLRQYYCTRFEVTTEFQVDENVHSDLLQKGLIAAENNMPGAIYIKKYRPKDIHHGCIFHCVGDTSPGTKGKVQYECHLEYRCGTPHSAWKALSVKQFSQLTDVFRNSATELKSTVRALFQFPLESFEPKLQLPLTLQEDVDGKTVRMSGCELQVKSGSQEYSQYIGVKESNVISGVSSMGIDDPLSSTSIRAKFRECINISRDMVKRIKGGSKR